MSSKIIEDIKVLSHLSAKRKVVMGLIIILCFLSGFIFAFGYRSVYFSAAKSDITNISMIPKVFNDKAILTLSSNLPETTKGKEFDLNINLKSDIKAIDGSDVIINFDPNYLKPVKIKTGNYFKNYPIQNIGTKSIRITAVPTIKNNQLVLPKGNGLLSTITFITLKETPGTIISINNKSLVTSQGENILDQGKLNNLTVKINN